MSTIEDRYAHVVEEVRKAALGVGRDPADIRIVAVSKTVGIDVVGEAVACGIHDFGENRAEVMMPKRAAWPNENWHFIGNLQTRKVRDIVGASCLIHSVDRAHIIPRLQDRAESLGIQQAILLEVNVSGEVSKSGFRPDEVEGVLQSFDEYPALLVQGLMTMAPQADEDVVRSTFRSLRELRDRLGTVRFGANVSLQHLSMGMSGDYRIAVEEGSTIVRVGRSIFSEDFAEV